MTDAPKEQKSVCAPTNCGNRTDALKIAQTTTGNWRVQTEEGMTVPGAAQTGNAKAPAPE